MFKRPRNSILLKAIIIGVLAMTMLIPLGMIEGLIAERASRRQEAVASVQASFAGPQTVALPFFLWPYVEQWNEQTVDAANRVRTTPMSESKQLVWFAERAQADVDVAVQNDRYRGIHRVRTYHSTVAINGTFNWPDRDAVKPSGEDRRITWGEPRMVLAISDVRGLRGTPNVQVEGSPLTFREGTQVHALPAGVHVTLTPAAAGAARFAMAIELAGTEFLAFAPTATASNVSVKSSWPDPHFGGSYLPRERTVSAAGFSAEWSVSALASDVQQEIRALVAQHGERPQSPHRAGTKLSTFDIGFIEAVNTYLLAERSAKHGALIIVLIFGALFLFDTLRSLNAHPVQYGFVGLALTIFFLLLLSLSEHVAFGFAYVIAATACTLLVTYYLRYVLGGTARAFAFGGALLAIYATIYAVLIAEGAALLMGSVLLFVMLAAAMIVTRRIDWRALTRVTETSS